MDDVLRVHAGTLEELSLLLYLEPNFFSALLAGGGRGDGTVGFRFPALHALCLLRQHPADVAKLVAAAPSLSAIRFLFGMPKIDGPSFCGWPAPTYFMGEPDELHPMLETALAPAVGRGQLTSVELDTHCRIGVTEVFAELPGLAGFHETVRSVSLTLRFSGELPCFFDDTLHLPSLRSLSLVFLHLRRDDFPSLQGKLRKLPNASSRLPLLSDLHIEMEGDGWRSDEYPTRHCVALAAPHPRPVDLPALKRLHLKLPVVGIAVVLCSLSSASLEVVSLSGENRELLPTSSLAGLPSRFPALHAVRFACMRLDPATLALWGLAGYCHDCSLSSPLRSIDRARILATQFFR